MVRFMLICKPIERELTCYLCWNSQPMNTMSLHLFRSLLISLFCPSYHLGKNCFTRCLSHFYTYLLTPLSYLLCVNPVAFFKLHQLETVRQFLNMSTNSLTFFPSKGGVLPLSVNWTHWIPYNDKLWHKWWYMTSETRS